MSLSLRPAVWLFAFAGFCGILSLAGCNRADEAAKAKTPPSANIPREQTADDRSKTDSTAKAVTPTAFSSAEPANAEAAAPASAILEANALPEGTAELLAYLRKLDAVRLEEDTREARAEFARVQDAIVEGADKLLAKKDLAEDARLEGVKLKWTSSVLLVNLDVAGAEERFLKFANELVDDKNPLIGRTARLQLRQLDVMKTLQALLRGATKNTDKLMQDLNLILSEEGLRYGQYEILEQAARIL